MTTDLHGNTLSTSDVTATQAVNAFVSGFLGYTPQILQVLPAAERHPEHGLLNTLAAAVCLFAESPAAPAQAAPYLAAAARAVTHGSGATERERGWLAHVQAWADDDIDLAQRIADELLTANPRDLAMLKLHQYHSFNRGECAAMLRAARRSMPVAREVPEVHGMLAFALEQCHHLEAAESAAREALAMTRQEPWAQHALAHVLLTQGRLAEGRDFLRQHSDTWRGLVSFIETHNHWHLALFELALGETAAALARYDEQVWAHDHSYSQDQVGAVSLLARIELAGGEVGHRWQALAPWLQARANDATLPFLSVQYAYGLLRAAAVHADAASAEAAKALLVAASARAHQEHTLPPPRRVWERVAVPLIQGMFQYTQGDAMGAVSTWAPLQGQLLSLGGSHAQRDLFAQLYIDALLQAGEWNTAQQWLELRRVQDPDGIPLQRLLGRTYDALGLPREAAMARARAQAPTGHAGTDAGRG